jgi:protein-disulfide isomerase
MRPFAAAALLASGLALAAHAPADDGSDEKQVKARVERYLSHYFRLAPADSLTVDQVWSVEKPPLWGLAVTRKQGGKTETSVYMLARDFSTLHLGRVLDFSRDLPAENRSKLSLEGAPSRGAPGAPVTLVEMCEFQCPDCRAVVSKLAKVLPAYPGKVRVVFKNLMILNRHDLAEPTAIAARCAFDQKPEAFWSFHDALFEDQDAINAANLREKVQALGSGAGLDRAKLLACYDLKQPLPVLQQDMYEAARVGARGTPTLLVNGRFVFSEELTEEDLRKLIDEALAEAAQGP